MEILRLGDIADIVAGSSAPKDELFNEHEGIPFIRAGHLKDLCNGTSLSNIPKIAENKAKGLVQVPKGTILFAKSGMSCMKGRVYKTIENAYIVNHLAGIICSEKISSNYLKYYFMYYKPNRLVLDSSYPSIRLSDIANIKVAIPTLEKQIKVAKILDKSQELIDIRKAQIKDLDELVKSRFIEMFGDPVKNPKNFELLTVDDVIEFQGGSQPDKKYFEYKKTEDNIRLIQIRDYKTDAYVTYIPKDMAKRFCSADDIMIGRYGPPIFQILKGIEGSYNVALLKATPKKGNKEFIRQFLKQECLFNYLEGLSQRTAGQSGIDMPKLKQYPFPYPPIELQNEFADFVKHTEKLKFEMKKSLKELEDNYNSLMQRAFKGELFK